LAIKHSYFDDAALREGLHQRSLRGGAISMLAQGGNLTLQIVSTIVLARILLPEDFGLVAMVAAITGYGSVVIDLGTRDAVVQRRSINEGEVSALFWITLAIGVALTAITILVAPLLAHFYAEPRLRDIAIAMSITFLAPALYYQQYALMRRALLFRKLAVIDFGSSLLATVLAIVLASRGYGYWAIVCKAVFTVVFTAFGVWLSCGWWPKRPSFTRGVREIYGFGLNITAFLITDIVARSADRVALGYTAGPRELGYYQNAFTAYEGGLTICVSLHNVASATLSKLRDDVPALQRAWSTALSSLTYFAAPGGAILAVIAQDLVFLVLGSKWKAAGLILSVLALRFATQVIERTNGWLHIAAGRPDRWRHWGILSCIVTLVALFCGLPFGGVGIAAAYAVSSYCLFIPAIAYAGKPLGIRAADVLKAVGPQVGTALGVAAVGFALRYTLLEHTSPLARIIGLTVLCSALYLATMTLGFRMTKPLTVLASLLRARKDAVS
jgi:PST family polysaccharide transporter